MDAALTSLTTSGPLGAVLVVVIVLFVQQSKQLAAVQMARVEDANKVMTLLLKLNSDNNTIVAGLTQAIRDIQRGS